MSEKPTRKSSARLLLPIVKREPEKTKLPVNLSQDVHTDLLAYQRAYQDMNGARCRSTSSSNMYSCNT